MRAWVEGFDFGNLMEEFCECQRFSCNASNQAGANIEPKSCSDSRRSFQIAKMAYLQSFYCPRSLPAEAGNGGTPPSGGVQPAVKTRRSNTDVAGANVEFVSISTTYNLNFKHSHDNITIKKSWQIFSANSFYLFYARVRSRLSTFRPFRRPCHPFRRHRRPERETQALSLRKPGTRW